MAHRRENTLEAFRYACALGATAVETDAWVTADGVAVLHHDATVRSPSGRRVPIAVLQRAELPAHIPSLADLYAGCGADLDIAVDVLDPAAAPALVAAARAAAPAACSRLWLCGTRLEAVAAWRQLDPAVHLVLSDDAWRRHRRDLDRHLDQLTAAGIEVLNLHQRFCSAALAEACHRRGLLLFAWDVQRRSAMRRMLACGIDALMSDHVDRMVAELARSPAAAARPI